MKGYYKNDEATASVFDADGWMNTGDICNVDSDGYIYIRGRDKNMILGPSGQNIYPEEIEHLLNNMPYVNESLVVEKDGKLSSPRSSRYRSSICCRRKCLRSSSRWKKNISDLNRDLPDYSRIAEVKEYFRRSSKKRRSVR